MRKVLANYGNRIFIKSPNSGCDELRTEICSYLARNRGIFVKPSQIIVGSGAEYLYGLIAQLFRDRDKFAIEQPSYDKIRKVYEAMGIQCDMLSLTRDGISSKVGSDRRNYIACHSVQQFPKRRYRQHIKET